MGEASEVDSTAIPEDRSPLERPAPSGPNVGREPRDVVAPRGTRLATTAWNITALTAAALAVTTAIASFVVWTEYVPDLAIERCDLDASTVCAARDGAQRAFDWRLAAISLTAMLLLAVAVWAVVRAVRTRSGRAVGAAVASIVGSALAVLTGTLGASLAWDQLALWNVEVVGVGRFRGLGWLFDERADSVRFVLVSGVETGVDTFRRLVLLTVGSAMGTFALLAVALLLMKPTESVAEIDP